MDHAPLHKSTVFLVLITATIDTITIINDSSHGKIGKWKNDTTSVAPAARRSRTNHHPAAETEDEAAMHASDDEMQVSDAGASDRLEEPERIQPSIYAMLSHGMLLCCGSLP
jgi:hypothetical protein